VALVLAMLGACGPGPKPEPEDEVPCTAERTIELTVTGAVGASDAGVVGVLDASTWRLGDAAPLTTTRARDGGAFTLCLTTDPPVVNLYEMGFFAAWIDLDADGRLDAATEPLCDRTDAGVLPEPLYFEAAAWRVGLAGIPGADLSPTAPLDGDACSR
jgi:hypothetical protein